MKELLVALLPALAGAIPAFLLYLQGKNSGEREAADRAAERASEEKRREQEIVRERMRLEAEGRSIAEEHRRDRFTRFLRIIQQLDTGVHASNINGYVFQVSDAERKELAIAYEDVLLDAPAELAEEITSARSWLDQMLEASAHSAEAAAQPRRELHNNLDRIRRLVRELLQAAH